jgi:hypothetical protein
MIGLVKAPLSNNNNKVWSQVAAMKSGSTKMYIQKNTLGRHFKVVENIYRNKTFKWY